MYELVTCDYEMICPDGVQRSSCSWERYFFLFCLSPAVTGSGTGLRLATNALPNHCYYTDTDQYPVQTQTPDFDEYVLKMVFNLPWTSTDSYSSMVLSGAESQ